MFKIARRKLLGLAAATLAVFAVVTPSHAADPLKVGFSMSLTGPGAPAGKQILIALEIWRDDVNAKGGLLGRPVELTFYDDQSNPANVPGIYAKLLTVDKVDLLVGPYSTNMTAAAMPAIIQQKKMTISLLTIGVNEKFNYPGHFSMVPVGPDGVRAFSQGFFELAAAQNPKPKTVAIIAADSEFARTSADGARENAKKFGFQIVYDKSYPPPPKTTDFTPVVRALQAANADMVVICSYPADSVGIVEAANEVGLKPKMFGGAMVGLQVTAVKEKLKGKLNGIVNYETWVPDKKQMYKGTEAFFQEYQARAKTAGVDPLGYYLGGWGYTYVQILGDAIKGANSIDDDKLAAYLKSHSFDTIMGPVKFGNKGEWAESRMLTVQYHDIKPDVDMKTWAGMSYQTVLHPKNLETGKLIFPYEKAHQ